MQPLSSQSDFDGPSNVQVNQYKAVPQSSGSDIDSMNRALMTGASASNSSSSGNFEPEAIGGATGGAHKAAKPEEAVGSFIQSAVATSVDNQVTRGRQQKADEFNLGQVSSLSANDSASSSSAF